MSFVALLPKRLNSSECSAASVCNKTQVISALDNVKSGDAAGTYPPTMTTLESPSMLQEVMGCRPPDAI